MKKKYFFIILLLISISNTYCQNFDTFESKFVRVLKQTGCKDETVNGQLFFNKNKSTIIIENPIDQWMIFENDILLIYYPKDRNVIRIKSQNPVTMPFSQLFLNIFSDNMELSKSGYTLLKNELCGDTLSIFWKPPEILEKSISEYIIKMKDKKIISIEVKNTDKNTIMSVLYDNYIQCSHQFIPLKIVTYFYSRKKMTTEVIELFNPVFNKHFPQNVINFKLPDDIEIKDIEW